MTLRNRWWLYMLGGSAQLQIYQQFIDGKIKASELDKSLLVSVARERVEELGGWPLHQEAGARPKGGASPLVLRALASLASRYLCWHAGTIAFRPERLLEWREQVAHRLDPDLLVMTAAALDVLDDPEHLVPRHIDARVMHQITEAPLIPPVALPEVEALRKDGLTEIHRHLSLARLPAMLWSDALVERDVDLSDPAPKPYVSWSQLLRHACALRTAILGNLEQAGADATDNLDALRIPHPIRVRPWEFAGSERADPTRALAGARAGRISRERALLLHSLRAVSLPDAPRELGWLIHAYLLVRQLTVASILQPSAGRKGLDRFKHGYVDSGWHGFGYGHAKIEGLQQAWRTGGVRWLEGKVSSKVPASGHLHALLAERRASTSLLERLRDRTPPDPKALLADSPDEERPAIRFTFHFLKVPDVPIADSSQISLRRVSFQQLRERVHEQGLRLLDEATDPAYTQFIVGLDVASLETSAPIEVFAPVLRAIRAPWPIPPVRLPGRKRYRMRDFGLAVHAGEEFRHLAEGIRRVVETLEFCAYRAGDRLGHALSLGVEPESWANRWQRGVVMPTQVRLDDVVWMWGALDTLPSHAPLRTRLFAEVHTLFERVYRRPFPGMEALIAAWRLRAEDPLSYRTLGKHGLLAMGPLRRHMRASLEHALHVATRDARDLWWDTMTDSKVSRRGEEPIDVDLVSDELSALRDLQNWVIRRLVRERIAIEINPSSNLAIGPISRLSEHPVFRWAAPDSVDDAHRPVVVVGSDDPAIFGSELIQEYALLALAAEQRGASPRAVARWLRELSQDARSFRFDGGSD